MPDKWLLTLILLTGIFWNSFSKGYISSVWRKMELTFIPKAGKTEPVLKSDLLVQHRFSAQQWSGWWISTLGIIKHYAKSTELALHSPTTLLEKRQWAFQDVQGANDNTPYQAIKMWTRRKAIQTSVTRWIKAMLTSRETTAIAPRGCSQWGAVSLKPVQWVVKLLGTDSYVYI